MARSVDGNEVESTSTTSARRRRPSSKPTKVVTEPERRAAEARTEQRAKGKRLAGRTGTPKVDRLHEDKREARSEMVTDARPKNLKLAKNSRKDKGKAAYAQEASSPSKRPSRKSTRRAANHVKADSQLRRRSTRAARSSKHRAAMQGA